MDKNSVCTDVGTGIPDRIRDLCQLLSDPVRPETHTSDSCQYVQLYTTDHCDRNQHHTCHGDTDMAETPGRIHGFRRSIHSQPQSCKGIISAAGRYIGDMPPPARGCLPIGRRGSPEYLPAADICCRITAELLILIPALDLDLVNAHRAECTDERSSKTRVGNQWNIEVNCCSTNVISVSQLSV